MTAPPGSARLASNTGRPAEIRVSKTMRHRLAGALSEATGLSFAAARSVIAERTSQGETPNEIEAYLRATFRVDPTGVTAVRNVSRERGRQ